MVARTPSGSAVEPPAENWWASVSGAGDFPVWEGSEAAAKRAAADAEALQADAFDALMDAQDAGAGDAAAAEAAKQAARAVAGGATEDIETLQQAAAAAILNGSEASIIEAAVGLTEAAAAGAFASALVSTGRIDPADVAREKKRRLDGVPGLEWWSPEPGGLSAIGGLENVKAWLQDVADGMTPAAQEYGLAAPRGAFCGS